MYIYIHQKEDGTEIERGHERRGQRDGWEREEEERREPAYKPEEAKGREYWIQKVEGEREKER